MFNYPRDTYVSSSPSPIWSSLLFLHFLACSHCLCPFRTQCSIVNPHSNTFLSLPYTLSHFPVQYDLNLERCLLPGRVIMNPIWNPSFRTRVSDSRPAWPSGLVPCSATPEGPRRTASAMGTHRKVSWAFNFLDTRRHMVSLSLLQTFLLEVQASASLSHFDSLTPRPLPDPTWPGATQHLS